MRDCVNNRSGFDRVLIAVAATFLTVSAGSGGAQSDPARSNAAEFAIDAAVPRPEPANVPPPTINDFKIDSTAAITEPAKADAPRIDTSKLDTPRLDTPKLDTGKKDDAAAPAAPPATAAAPAAEPAKEPVRAASTVPPADQPIADRLRDMFGNKSVRVFDRKVERVAAEKFYGAREFAPIWTQGGGLTANAKGVIARLRDAAADGLDAADYPVPDFAAATTPDALADADLKLTASMLDYARQAQSGRMHWSQVSADIKYPKHPPAPPGVLTSVTPAKDASATLEGYNPPQRLFKELKKKLAELRGQGEVAT